MARKLLEKAGLVQMPVMPKNPSPGLPSEAGRPKTAPGSMMHFMSSQSAAVKEAESLRERLAGFEGALPVRKLDPTIIRASAWANRHPASFDDDAFIDLKADIASAGGNVQPIKIRPLRTAQRQGVGRSNSPGGAAPDENAKEGVGPSNPLHSVPPPTYEIVYGHRRHRACLDLGLPVLSLIEDVPEQQMFIEMERENRSRQDMSAWEQGCMYARALDSGLFPSNRQLATAIGRDLGDIGKALALARLPKVVVEAFASPLDLQYRWAKPLNDAQQRDPEGLMLRAKALKELSTPLAAKRVFQALVTKEEGVGPSNPPAVIDIRNDDKVMATVSDDMNQRTLIRIEVALTASQKKTLIDLLRQFLDAPIAGIS